LCQIKLIRRSLPDELDLFFGAAKPAFKPQIPILVGK
jgi:hypothetical protein